MRMVRCQRTLRVLLVRKEACHSLINLLLTDYKNTTKTLIYQMIIDPSPVIRKELLYLVESQKIQDDELCKEILETYRLDANYYIRERSNSCCLYKQ